MDKLRIICAADIPEPGTSHFIPWRLEMLYQIEPALIGIAERAVAQKRRCLKRRCEAYCGAKCQAEHLIGWNARDPRLRSDGAWNCFFNYIVKELRL